MKYTILTFLRFLIAYKPLFHKISERELIWLNNSGKSWDWICKRYRQPKWCLMENAMLGMGCWTLTETNPSNRKVCYSFCKTCPYFDEEYNLELYGK